MLRSIRMTPFLRVRAVNTAPDSENRIHQDSVAAEYGFRGGLVPGVTIYGYLAAAVIDRLGPQWLHCGAMDVRFFEPFYEGEEVAVSITDLPEKRIKIEAGSRASATAWFDNVSDNVSGNVSGNVTDDAAQPAEHSAPKQDASRETMQPGKLLGTFEKTLDLSQPGVSAPLDAFIGPERFAHPAIILGLANELLMHNYNLGPWIHASSEVRNAKPARDGEHLEVRGKIADAFERKGHEFVILDVAILSAGALLSRIRHTAIWKPAK
jgi:hypothetical protein